MTNISWALLQDSFYTTLCLEEPPQVLATAVLYLATQCCKLTLPGSELAKRQWWEVFSPGASEKKLQEISRKIMQCITNANIKEKT